jgi:hypothetical protein
VPVSTLLSTFLFVHVLVCPYTKSTDPISEPQLNMLRNGFTSVYLGRAVEAFLEYLKRNNQAFHLAGKEMYYGKFCSIVQSSGTGKTRLMLEASFHRCI